MKITFQKGAMTCISRFSNVKQPDLGCKKLYEVFITMITCIVPYTYLTLYNLFLDGGKYAKYILRAVDDSIPLTFKYKTTWQGQGVMRSTTQACGIQAVAATNSIHVHVHML